MTKLWQFTLHVQVCTIQYMCELYCSLQKFLCKNMFANFVLKFFCNVQSLFSIQLLTTLYMYVC